MFLLPILLLAAAAPWLWPHVSSRLTEGRTGDKGVEQTAAGSADDADALASSASGESQPAVRAAAAQQEPGPPRAEPAPIAGAGRARSISRGNVQGPGMPAATPTDAPSDATQQTLPDTRQLATPAPDAGVGSQSGSGKEPASESDRPAGTESESESESASEPRENFIRAWDLPQAQRAEFPDLNLTVHFYSQAPGDRFVLINGERYSEGQQVEPGIRLAEIRRRGAVVDFSGYRVLIE